MSKTGNRAYTRGMHGHRRKVRRRQTPLRPDPCYGRKIYTMQRPRDIKQQSRAHEIAPYPSLRLIPNPMRYTNVRQDFLVATRPARASYTSPGRFTPSVAVRNPPRPRTFTLWVEHHAGPFLSFPQQERKRGFPSFGCPVSEISISTISRFRVRACVP